MSTRPATSSAAKPASEASRRATARLRAQQRRRPRVSRLLAWLLAAWLGHAGLSLAQVAPSALPSGGQVMVGSGQLQLSPNLLVIQQSSHRLGLDWQSFNIGSAATVEFRQPDASSVALNRVVGNSGSEIYGNLKANGQVFLTNPNGVLFAPGSKVDVGGLVASTLDLSQQDFADGRYVFNAGGAHGRVVNQGSLNASAGGYLALFGQTVDNQGDIAVQAGSVVLASGRAATVSISGSGLISAVVSPGMVQGSVDNSGRISADGGVVTLSAKSAQDIAASLVNNSGIVRANTLVERAGEVWITGDQVTSSGQIQAAAPSGGDGGRVMLIGDMQRGTAQLTGNINASAAGGMGGFVETSAASVTIADSARVTTTAPGGSAGTWLIDPTNFAIVAGGGALTASSIGADTLSTNLGGGNVTIATAAAANGSDLGDISVGAPVSWSANKLTLNAHNNILVNAALTGSGTASLAFEYGQGALAAGNTSTYTIGAPVNLPAGNSFSTKLGSNGTTQTFAVVVDAAGLQGIDTLSRTGNYAIGANIDLSSIGNFNPIGNEASATFSAGNSFAGRFEGLGNTVSGLTTTGYLAAGLFATTTTGADIRHLGFSGGSVSGTTYAGTLAGLTSGATVSRVSSSTPVTVTGAGTTPAVGGLIGQSSAGSMTNATVGSVGSPVAISGGNYTGGLVGNSQTTAINNGIAAVTLTGAAVHMGGLAGNSTGAISGSSATGTAQTSGNTVSGGLGGLVGQSGASVTNSSADVAVTATNAGSYVGGLIGASSGSVTSSTASGSVTGGARAGGLVGSFGVASISASSASGTVTSTVSGADVGGLVAFASGTGSITNSSATGMVSASASSDSVGGLVGEFTMTGGIINSSAGASASGPSAATTVTGGTYTGGVVGRYNSAAALVNDASNTVAFRGSTVTGVTWVGGVVGYSDQATAAITIAGPGASTPLATNVVATGANGAAGVLAGRTGGAVAGFTSSGTVTSAGSAGGLIGTAAGTGGVSNVSASGAVTGTGTAGSVGGLVGSYTNTGNLTGIMATGNVSGGLYTGGLVGNFSPGAASVSAATAAGNVSGLGDAGGLIGFASGTGSLSASSTTGSVVSSAAATYSVGGAVGYFALSGGINTTTSAGNVTGGAHTGGVIGYYNTTTTLSGVSTTPAVTTVTGSTWVGGVVGYVNSAATLSGLAGTANVSATGPNGGAGGLAGRSNGSVTGSSASGNVSGFDDVGGLIGYAVGTGTMSNVGASGSATSTSTSGAAYAGGLVGRYALSGGITGTATATGVVTGGSSAGGFVGYWNSPAAIAGLSRGTATVTGRDYIGGVVGYSEAASVSGLASAANVTATGTGVGAAGGVAGRTTGNVASSSATGDVSGRYTVGGLVGLAEGTGAISDGSATGSVTSSTATAWIGGLVGQYALNGSITGTISASGVVSGGSSAGGVVGYYNSTAPISGLTRGSASVTGQDWVGGLIGYSRASSITGSSSAANVTATGNGYAAGGLVGGTIGSISSSSATGSVTAAGDAGGLIGRAEGTGALTDVSASGSVTSSSTSARVGGLAGYVTSGAILRGTASGAVSGGGETGGLVGAYSDPAGIQSSSTAVTSTVSGNNYVGGLVGNATSSGGYSDVTARGNVSGGNYAGGLIGQLSGAGAVTTALATGKVTSNGSYIGGLIGYWNSGSSITDSRAEGNVVSGNQGGYVGGLVGYSIHYSTTSNITNSSAAGNVSGGTYVGGLIGLAYDTQIVRGTTTGSVGSNSDSTTFVGGLVGYFGDYYFGGHQISNSSATGAVAVDSPYTYAGGLVGYFSAGTINASTAGGGVTARDSVNSGSSSHSVGGLVGYFSGTGISDSAAAGNVDSGYYAGGLAGYYSGTAQLTNSSATGNVTGTQYVGGLVGIHQGAGITNGFASGQVTATGSGYTGGLVGYAQVTASGNLAGINDSRATGNVSGGSSAGGLVGYMYDYNSTAGTVSGISNSRASGSVSASNVAGGLVGYFSGGYANVTGGISNSSASGNVAANQSVGGLVGNHDGYGGVRDSFATGSVLGLGNSSDKSLGGLVGRFQNSHSTAGAGLLTRSYATGAVSLAGNLTFGSGTDIYAGGLVGSLNGYNISATTLTDSYATGAVTIAAGSLGRLRAGGLVGNASGGISNSYSIGAVSATGGSTRTVGGLVAQGNSSVVTSSFWATDTSGQASSDGGTASTLAAMKDDATFTGWDMATASGSTSVWRIYDTLTTPLLRSLLTPLTLNLADVSKVYDGTGSLGNAPISVNGTAVSNPERILVAGVTGNVGTHAVTAANLYSVQTGYDLGITGTANLTITGRPLTLAGLVANKVYDGGTSASLVSNPQPSGLVTGDDLVFQAGSGFGLQFATKTAGTGKTVNISGGYSFADGTVGRAANYILPTAATTTADITPAPLTAGSFTTTNRAYDGTTTVAVSAASSTLTGVIGSDSVNVDLSQVTGGTVTSKNVGTAKPVSVAGVVLGGADAVNYTLAGLDSVLVDITPKALTVNGIGATNRQYDRSTNVSLTTGSVSLAGVVSDDDVQLRLSGLTGTMADKNVANGKAVTVTGVALRGVDAGNYAPQAGAVNVNITPRAVTMYLTTTGQTNRVYNGTATASVALYNDFTYSTSTFSQGDDVTVSTSSIGYSDKNVAYNASGAVTSKTITASGISISGTDAYNFALQNTTATTTGTISPKPLTVSGVAAVSRVYDGTRDVTVNIDGATVDTTAVVAGDVVGVATPGSGTVNGQTADKNVGNAKAVTVPGLTLTGADAGNYSITSASGGGVTVNITRKDVTATYTAANKVYDGDQYATIDVTYTGLVAGDSIFSYVDRTICGNNACGRAFFTDGTAANTASRHVGTAKPVVISNNFLYTGNDIGNYNLVNPNGTSVADITPKPVTLAFSGVSKVYDGTVDAMVTLNNNASGVFSGDAVTTTQSAVYTGATAKNVGTGKAISVTGISLSGANAGNYTVSNTSANTSGTVTAKPITVSGITATDRAYDGTTTVAVTAGTVTSTGFVSGDTVSVSVPSGGLSTGTIANKNVGTNKPVTVTGLTLTGGDAGNYSIDAAGSGITVNITSRALTPTYTGVNREYNGGITVAVTPTTTGVASGDTVTFNQQAVFTGVSARDVGTAKPVSVSSITLGGASAANYSLVSTTATTTADITPKAVTPIYTGASRTYNGLADVSASVVGSSLQFIAGDDVRLTQTARFTGDGSAGTDKPVSVTAIGLTGGQAANYSLVNTTASTAATITPRPLGVTGVTSTNRVYDGTITVAVNVANATVDTSAKVAGDDVVAALPPNGITTGSMSDRHVGNNKQVSITGVTLSGAQAANYSLIGATGLTVNITPLSLTATYAAASKVYNGSAEAQVSATSNDILLIDAATLGFSAQGVFSGTGGRNVGVAKAVDISGGFLTGASRDNYSLTNTSGSATADITPRVLTANYGGGVKVYDGTVTAVVTGSLANRISGDNVATTQTAEFTGAGARNVGNGKPISVSSIALTGADAGNYTLANTTDTTTGSITPKPITVGGLSNVLAVDRVYDGTVRVDVNVPAGVTLVPSTTDILAGDVVTIAVPSSGVTSGIVASKNVGNGKAVTVDGLTLSGTDAANYAIAGTAGITVNISAKSLTASYAGVNRAYDGTLNASVTGTSTDIIGGDSVTIGGSGVFTDAGGKNVGIGKTIDVLQAQLSGGDGANYTLVNTTGSTTGEVTRRSVTASYTSPGKIYDGSVAAPVSGSAGFIFGDQVSLAQTAVFTGANAKNVGDGKAIQVSGITLDGSDALNYSLTNSSASAQGSIRPKPIGILGLTGVSAQNRVYDGTTAVTVDVQSTGTISVNTADIIAGDDVTVTVPSTGTTTGVVANKNVGSAKPVTVTGLALSGPDAPNYTISVASGVTIDITPKALTASYADLTRIYDGTAAAAITGTSADVISGDVLGISGSGLFTGVGAKNVGTAKPVDVLSATLAGTDAANYSLVNPTGSTTGSITPRSVSVSYVGGTRVYDGSVNAPVTGTAAGFIGGDDISLTQTAQFTGTGAKNVGAGKAVSISGVTLGGVDAGNYALLTTTAATTASITPRPLRIEGFTGVVATDRVYDGTTAVAISIQGSGAIAPNATDVVTGDDVSVVAPPTGASAGSMADKNVGSSKPVTVDGLTLTGVDAGNYSVAAASGVTVNITPRSLTAVYNGLNKVYDGTSLAGFAGSSADILAGDVVTITGSGLFTGAGARNVGTGKAVSITGAGLGSADAGNYSLLNPTGSTTADITPRPLTPTFTGGTRIYDGTTNAPVTLATGNVIAGDELSLTQTAVFDGGGARNVGIDKPVLVSGITVQGADAANYALTATSASTTATITPRPLNIGGLTGLQAVNRVYDGTRDVQITGSAVIGTATSDVISGDDVVINLPSGSISTGTMVDKSAGTGKAVAVSGLSLSGVDAPNYQITGVAGLTVNIAPRPVVLLGVSAINRVYDGSTVVAINSAGGGLSGVLAGDDLQLLASGVTGSMADKHVGSGKAVAVTGLSFTGADIANYTVDGGGDLRVDITPRTLVATATAADRFYDGSNVAAVTLVDDRIAGDTLALTNSSATFAGRDAGAAQTVSIGGLALTGADAGDYVLLANSLTTTASIDRAPLSVTANALSKVYGESVNLTGTEFTTLGLVAGESLGLVTLASDGTSSAAPVTGSPYAITASDARGGSFNPANYALSYGSGLLTVTPRPLTVAANSVVRTADEPNPASFGFSTNVGGLVGGDSIASVVLNAPAGSATATGGSIFELLPSAAVFGNGQASNYALSYDTGLLVVLPKPPRVDDVDPNAANPGQQGFAVQVDQAELDRALGALERNASVVAQVGAERAIGLPAALRNVDTLAAEISVAQAGDSRRITLPDLLRLPLISFDPSLRRLILGGPAAGSNPPPPSSTAP